MGEVGVRALKQNASAVVAAAAAGEIVTITDRGRPVAQMVGLGGSALARLRVSGRLRPARSDLRALAAPERGGAALSAELAAMRADER